VGRQRVDQSGTGGVDLGLVEDLSRLAGGSFQSPSAGLTLISSCSPFPGRVTASGSATGSRSSSGDDPALSVRSGSGSTATPGIPATPGITATPGIPSTPATSGAIAAIDG
jgi:hypothetical protein